ncbi:T9SS type A sorting domain-containing protein [Flavobacterium pectinovorum]|uniref:T9SS type A sorting domain-containing protein n=1 Tax=Flavobacterium pectinovorum TaxID=29533 RepID=UPI001FAC6934|nr:T9SS type A sorting domain-containing protein [Flavobacterium pectinovorum]MCI9846106.1 SMP-30/gluconolactonase/LRE family protein [Flavobacterium pectinovorum]
MNKNYLLLFVLFCINSIQAQDVTTLAGSTSGFADGTGTAAQFKNPVGVCTDSNGNIFVADSDNYMIRKITPAGVVTTFAGSTNSGYTDATGTAAKFSLVYGICIDKNDNIFVSDNTKIRKITPAGVVTTFVGSSSSGNVDGTGTAARFYNLAGICIDANNTLYVADSQNHRIRKITSEGVVTTLAGSSDGFDDGTGTAAKFSEPGAVCVDASGNVYVADTGNHKIRKITSAGDVTTFAGSANGFVNGTGTAARFSYPFGICIDASNNLYVGDMNNNKIRKITTTGVVTTFAGSSRGSADGTGTAALFYYPWGLSINNGIMYVADSSNNRIRKITTATLGLNENNKAVTLTVYPNPATNILNIQLEEISPNTQLKISDILGKTIFTKKIEANITSISTESFKKGVYLITVLNSDKKTTQKVIIN